MQSPPLIRIGTRKSALAITQAELVCHKLQIAAPGTTFELVPLLTSGDKNANRSLADIGGKGLFTKELEEALLADRIDVAVHSLKDMETHLAPGLVIASVLEREDPRDVLIAPAARTLEKLPHGATVGTSSPRRAAQLLIRRPDLHIIPFRGNVTTRIEKIKKGDVSATLLARAGLKRLRIENEATEILDVDHFIPAAGQGVIAAECKENNASLCVLLSQIQHADTHTAILAERKVLATLGGSCRTPIAAYARLTNNELKLSAMIASPDGKFHVSVSCSAPAADAERMGEEAAKDLLARGGRECIA